MRKFNNPFIDRDYLVICPGFTCNWNGCLSHTIEAWVKHNPQTRREGWEYRCPQCNMIVDTHYTK